MKIPTASIGKDGGIVSNYAQVQKALEDYVKVRNQSVYDSVKEKMANIAFKAAQNTDFAPRATIKAKTSLSANHKGQWKKAHWEHAICRPL